VGGRTFCATTPTTEKSMPIPRPAVVAAIEIYTSMVAGVIKVS
jgi:hypothetical protein